MINKAIGKVLARTARGSQSTEIQTQEHCKKKQGLKDRWIHFAEFIVDQEMRATMIGFVWK
jgi:hypothetical protein